MSICISSGMANETAADVKTTLSTSNNTAAGVAVPTPETTNTQTEIQGEPLTDLATLTMTVYKSPTCGCCSAWVDYMEDEGFTVESIDSDNMDAVKKKLGLISPRLHSCHTAVIDGYIVEGHVPAEDVKRLLSERPDIVALSAPGMPMMSPGMASRTPKDYDVLSVDKVGDVRLWSAY